MRQLAPLYTFSGDLATWAARIAALQAGDAAIVTGPASGAPTDPDPLLVQHIADLKARDVTVFGYIPMGYGTRTVDDVFGQFKRWAALGVTRPFLDEWPTTWTDRHVGLAWCMARGYAGKGTADRPILIVNPGQPLGIVKPPDGVLVVTYEGVQPDERVPRPWEAAIVYSCPTPDAQRSRLATNGWSWSFVTPDGSDGNPFDGIEG